MPNTSATQKAQSSKQGEVPTRGNTSIIPSLPDDVSLRILAFLPRMSYSKLGLVSRAWRDAMRPNGPVIASRNRLNLLETWIVFVSDTVQGVRFLLVDTAHRGCLELIRPHPRPLRSAPIRRYRNINPMAAGNEILMPAPSYYAQATCQIPDTMYSFDVQSMEWTDPISLFTRNFHQNLHPLFASATLDGYLYVAGGANLKYKAARLDIASRTWEALPDLIEKRFCASAVVFQGCICIVGGFLSELGCKIVDSGEIWDPNCRQWTLIHELWPASVFGKQSQRPCIAVVKDRLYALRQVPHQMLQELMYYEDASKLWISIGKFCFSELVESKYAFHVLNEYPCRMVGVADELFVFCCAEPLAGTKRQNFLHYMVTLYVKPTLLEPLTWGIWPLFYPADYKAQPLILHV